MKFLADFTEDKLRYCVKDNVTLLKKNCYTIYYDGEFDGKKKIKKLVHLKDKDGNFLFEDGDDLKPKMGYADGEKEEIDIKKLDLWTLKEVLDYKYSKKLESLEKYSHVFYNEFIELNEVISLEGKLNIGKKICFGEGIIQHNIKMKDGKFHFECEYEGEQPNLEISFNKEKWTSMDKLPFSRAFRKSKPENIFLRIKCSSNILAYSFYYNGYKSQKNDFILSL